jgi:hypothetical protein
VWMPIRRHGLGKQHGRSAKTCHTDERPPLACAAARRELNRIYRLENPPQSLDVSKGARTERRFL